MVFLPQLGQIDNHGRYGKTWPRQATQFVCTALADYTKDKAASESLYFENCLHNKHDCYNYNDLYLKIQMIKFVLPSSSENLEKNFTKISFCMNRI